MRVYNLVSQPSKHGRSSGNAGLLVVLTKGIATMKIKEPDVLQNDEKELIESGAPLTVGDVYNYCQKYIPSDLTKADLTKEEFEELSNKVRKFISAWYSIKGNHQTRSKHAILVCNEQLH